jgi:hypothetical protein
MVRNSYLVIPACCITLKSNSLSGAYLMQRQIISSFGLRFVWGIPSWVTVARRSSSDTFTKLDAASWLLEAS